MYLYLVFFSLATLFSNPSFAKKKPSDFFTLCKLSDPELSSCIRKTLAESKPQIMKGIPELKLPTADPLVIPKISINQGQRNFKLSLGITNLTIRGLSNIETRTVEFSNDFKWGNFTSFAKKLFLDGDYDMDGKILLLPVKGNGQVKFVFDDVDFKAFISLGDYEKNGEKYISCNEFIWIIEPGKASSQFTNLFNGDKVLGETTNKFFNDNWKETYYTFKELPENAFGQIFKDIVNKMFSLHPAKDWFSDSKFKSE